MQALAIPIFVMQNRKQRVGGGISLIKAVWLTYVISLWYVLPMLLLRHLFAVGDASRTPADFAVQSPAAMGLLIFLGGVALRAIVELFLCYITRTWRVLYGVLFNILHLLCALAAAIVCYDAALPVFGHIFLLLCASILVELIFVRWFVQTTGGPAAGFYFVPDAPEYRWVHRWTLYLWLPQFAVLWTVLLFY